MGPGADPDLQRMRVLALTRFGEYASSVRVAAYNVFEIPALIDFDQAARLFVNYLTAYQLLVVLGGSHWKKSYKALRATGRLGLFGVSTLILSGMSRPLRFIKRVLQMPWYNPVKLMNGNKSGFCVNLGHLWDESEKIQVWMRHRKVLT